MNSSDAATRRNFRGRVALAPLAAAASTYALAPIKRTGGPLLKPTLNAYSFRGLLKENMEDASKGLTSWACAISARR